MVIYTPVQLSLLYSRCLVISSCTRSVVLIVLNVTLNRYLTQAGICKVTLQRSALIKDHDFQNFDVQLPVVDAKINNCATTNTTAGLRQDTYYELVVKYAYILVVSKLEGFWNRALYRLTSSSRSGASPSESLRGAWPRLKNFFANDLSPSLNPSLNPSLRPSHALLKPLFLFVRGGRTGGTRDGGGEGGGRGGGMEICSDGPGCGCSGTSIGHCPFSTVGDTSGGVFSQVERSRSSEWSLVGSGPISLSMSRRRFSTSTVWTRGTASPGSSPENWGEYTFFHKTRDINKPVRPTSWSGNP